VSYCRSCRAEILWVGTERGKAMPLDRGPYQGDDPRGLFVIRTDSGKPLAIAATPDAFPDEPVYTSHFSTCPDRDKWRRPR
jgi:hypothetical protein